MDDDGWITLHNLKLLKKKSEKILKEKDSKTKNKCEICDKQFKNNNGLMRHRNLAHNFVEEM